jgi:Tfp pilus assembly protein FimT
MARLLDDDGFTAVEVLVVALLTVTMAAIAIPATRDLFGTLRLSGDARALSNNAALAKMRAAADFTKARLYVDTAARTYHVDRWDKPTAGWVAEGSPAPLSYGVNMTTGGLATPPPNTQTAIGQAPACLDNAGAAVANTACVVFNSRGIPVDATGTPFGNDAFYLSDGTAVYGVTVAATGLIRTWKSGVTVARWTKQ